MLHRKGRLYEDRLELFHLKEGHQPELEQVITLKDAAVSEARELEVDVKPRGTNLFFGLVSGDIKSQAAVRPAGCCAWGNLGLRGTASAALPGSQRCRYLRATMIPLHGMLHARCDQRIRLR